MLFGGRLFLSVVFLSTFFTNFLSFIFLPLPLLPLFSISSPVPDSSSFAPFASLVSPLTPNLISFYVLRDISCPNRAPDWFYDSLPPPKKNSDILQRTFHVCSTRGRMLRKKKSSCMFRFAKDYYHYRTTTSGWQGTACSRRYARELVSKPTTSFKKS